ncbi:uncharacterized protein UV8b_01345 [Ustilaginoidea virens]|uniref:Nuclear envelope protein n=1 Tax=Ustilaginoidea virens TaxID=1159556 RepID=A0A8E5HKE1_USTVR|nr:uncharacterized protein UV8b_01345 [Ustilaginoidea virens]QUC17104.1 hypothetical protein UV8b_01345 [Ustilaginoidea virens]
MAAAPARRAPYKDTLQPALHRRFSSTAILLLVISYLEALFLASWSSYFWSWFPVGPAGFRTLLIFCCGLSILVLRIAHYHVGLKTAESGLQTLGSSLRSLSTYETAFWYSISSVLFSLVFLFSMDESANLKFITSLSGDRLRLNERPLFLACYLSICALVQTFSHYKHDIDHLDLGTSKRTAHRQQKALGLLPASFQAVLLQLPGTLAACAKQAVSALTICLFAYYLVLRSFAWGWALAFLRPIYNLPRTSAVPYTWPTDIYLLARCIYAGTLMNFVWSAGNTAFSVFMVTEPLKNGNPLTSESKDPNGSLLNGLKSKKLSIKSFAAWELFLIAQNFDARRQAIFSDIDRKDGPMWSQVYAFCMNLLNEMETRVDEFGKPSPSAAAQPAQAVEGEPRVPAALRQDPILMKKNGASGLMGGVEKAWDEIARAPGSSPVSELSPLAKKTWRDAKDKMLSKRQQEVLSAEHIRSELEGWTARLMRIDLIGGLFRHGFRTRLAGTVLGTPYAEPALYSHAIQALCLLAAHSLAEDQYGNVHRDVPSIVRTLTTAIRKVEGLKQRFPLHWTDPSGSKDCPEVEQVLDALRSGLERVVAKFEPYSNDLRLSRGDLRLAKEAMTKPEAPPETCAPKQKEADAAAKSIPRPKPKAKSKPKQAETNNSDSTNARRMETKEKEMEQVR